MWSKEKQKNTVFIRRTKQFGLKSKERCFRFNQRSRWDDSWDPIYDIWDLNKWSSPGTVDDGSTLWYDDIYDFDSLPATYLARFVQGCGVWACVLWKRLSAAFSLKIDLWRIHAPIPVHCSGYSSWIDVNSCVPQGTLLRDLDVMSMMYPKVIKPRACWQ